jgi:membrane protein YqaA with SNARE-associated domain
MAPSGGRGRSTASRPTRALAWLQRFGPKACLLSWLPIVGDPLCAVAGWLRLPFWPCVGWMALGKFLRFICYTAALLWLIPPDWLS